MSIFLVCIQMKNKPKLFSVLFFCLSILTFVPIGLSYLNDRNPLLVYDYKIASYNHKEEYDPSLNHLNSIERLSSYCDSLFYLSTAKYTPQQLGHTYTDIVSSVIKKRFYWGYSWYSFSDNYLGVVISKVTGGDYAAIVDPDDMMKHPNAACSQQAIIMMEILKGKGFKTRKVGFFATSKGGHFACEIFYGDKWHFWDPTLEPDTIVLNKFNRPDIRFLSENKDVLFTSYRNYSKDSTFLLDLFGHYSYGKPDVFPAKNALIFQETTKFISNTIWLFFLFGAVVLHNKNDNSTNLLTPKLYEYFLILTLYFLSASVGASPMYSPSSPPKFVAHEALPKK